MSLSRRGFITGTGAAIAALSMKDAFASTGLDWQAGYKTAPAEGFGPTQLKRLHGRLPRELKGRLYRNGPAQFQYGDDLLEHWFDGDGMVHAISFEDGAAVHTGRFVQTPKRVFEQKHGAFMAPGFGSGGHPDFPVASADDTNAANTSILVQNNNVYALWEAGSAYAIDPVSLETLGPKTWSDELAGMPFLAHPKVSPDGRVWNLAVGGSKVGIYNIAPSGEVSDFGMIDLGFAPYIHDFAMTKNHVLILAQPWMMTRSRPPFVNSLGWKPEESFKVFVVSKADMKVVRVSELPAFSFFHTGDAYEESDGTIRFDVGTYKDPEFGMQGEADVIAGRYTPMGQDRGAKLAMAVLPPSGPGRLEQLPIGAEFLRTDDRFQGVKKRHTWAVDTAERAHAPGAQRLNHYDWGSERLASHNYGSHHIIEEHVFVPRPGSSKEGDGWMIGTTLNMAAGATEVHVLDALNLNAGPIVSYRAPYAWPLGFHSAWAGA